ncbi:MAG: hypothetical protein QOC88_587 [Mycobacterium sp.]|jgi:hypothetical protein|nr:hypothetical protein [Mycobacterium sp.]
MTEDALRTADSGRTVMILIDDGTITISDGELTDQTANHLRVDVANAGKLGKVLIALAAALKGDSSLDRNAKQSETEGDDDRALLRAMAARAARIPGSSGWSSDQLALIDTLVSGGADREEFKTLTSERLVQFLEAWVEMDDRFNQAQCVVCGRTFTYERMGRPPLTCSAECRRKRKQSTDAPG